jgi:hypothetical protein
MVTGELLVPFLPFLGYELNSFNSLTTPKIPKTELSELSTWLSVYSLGPDPIEKTALVLFSGQPFPSSAFFLSCCLAITK